MIRECTELRGQTHVFRDRTHAGELLAALLATYLDCRPLVLAIPAGGVPVAIAVARALDAGLDVLPVSKMLFPWTTEAGFGAVAFDGTEWIDETRVPALLQSHPDYESAIAEARARVARRARSLRGSRPFPQVAGRTVILVDDGVAAGSTLRVAARCVRARRPARLVAAVPTGHAASLAALEEEVEEVCCANIRNGLRFAVADAYQDWRDVGEDEAQALLSDYGA
jgi:predicted phosphoribosyltransferase